MATRDCPYCAAPNPAIAIRCRICGELIAAADQPTDPDEFRDGLEFDYDLEQIGPWSTIKHDVVEKYASAYTTVLVNQPFARSIHYIDAFAGTGYAEARVTGDLLYGSAARALEVQPPFTHIHLIEQDSERAGSLRRHCGHDTRVKVYQGDAIRVLTNDVLPLCEYTKFARALCLLDPYGLSVPWTLLAQIGAMKSVEIFFNFMVVSANRNVLWRDPARVSETRKKRLDFVWGDRSWESLFYTTIGYDLFGSEVKVKASNESVVEAFRRRLESVAGFAYVPAPIPITNSRGATIYYLFFASPNKTGGKIVSDIFAPYRR